MRFAIAMVCGIALSFGTANEARGWSAGAGQDAGTATSTAGMLQHFAGEWSWKFHDNTFVTMTLTFEGDHLAGSMTNGYIRGNAEGEITDAGSEPGTSPVVRAFLTGKVLHVVVKDEKDGSLAEWAMTLRPGADAADVAPADAEGAKMLKPWTALRVRVDEKGNRLAMIGGEVSTPKLVKSVPPKFSERARRHRFKGACVVGIVVGVDGKPEQVTVVHSSGEEDLDRSAVEAVEQYRFKPAMRGGVAVPVQLNVEVNFEVI